ncbi:PD-(D/E)XK nuclease family protein [Acidobacteriia bacterium AH_259_A11_L15]|nr:PD-(D/E)XK nuclease family protein [Acidobacteriia bacterium AH_259_A11_L15]
MKQITIPARTLGMLRLPDFCPQCFWMVLRCDNKFPFQIPMPGIFSSIDAYGKRLIHRFFDEKKVLPPWFPNIGKASGYVPGHKLHWSRFKLEDPKTKITIRGTPDDIFRLLDGSYHIVDYKTAKATKRQDELLPLYEVQLNAYAYISKTQGLTPISGLGLIYMEPQTDVASDEITELMSEDDFSMKFEAKLEAVELKADRMIPKLLQRARKIFAKIKPPDGRETCKDCALLRQLLAIAQKRTE